MSKKTKKNGTTLAEKPSVEFPSAQGSDAAAQAPDSPPFVSLCVICGDDGAPVIERMLKSVLDRPSCPI